MRINQIFHESDSQYPEYQSLLRTIGKECKTFLNEAHDLPVFKALPTTYDNLQKVKVRKHRNGRTAFSRTFNEAFEDQVRDLRQRAVFTNSFDYSEPDKSLFYIFPKDGYKFMYCTEVTHSTQDYQQVFDSLFEQFQHERAEQLIRDVLKFAYIQENLHEGIEKEVEIIFYNVPYYYAARTDVFEYDELLTNISKLCDN